MPWCSPDTSAVQERGRRTELQSGVYVSYGDGKVKMATEVWGGTFFFPKGYHSQSGFVELWAFCSPRLSAATAKRLLCLHVELALSIPLCEGQFYIVHSLDHSWLISTGKSKFSRYCKINSLPHFKKHTVNYRKA